MLNNNRIPDWAIRAIKTFAQVFFGTLIPAVVLALSTPPESWSEFFPWLGGIFTPQLVIGDCLSAAICAAWNIVLEQSRKAP